MCKKIDQGHDSNLNFWQLLAFRFENKLIHATRKLQFNCYYTTEVTRVENMQ